MISMSLRLPNDLFDQLGALAEATGRTKSFLAIQALINFIDQEAWEIAEVKKGITEADTGDFAADEKIEALNAKWGYK